MSKTIITKEQVEHIARLAKLGVNQQELASYRNELAIIIKYFETIKDVDLKKITGTETTTPLQNVTRKDEVRPSLSQAEALSNVKVKKNGYILINSVLNNEAT